MGFLWPTYQDIMDALRLGQGLRSLRSERRLSSCQFAHSRYGLAVYRRMRTGPALDSAVLPPQRRTEPLGACPTLVCKSQDLREPAYPGGQKLHHRVLKRRPGAQYAVLASKLGRRGTESRSERLIEVRDVAETDIKGDI
jgi:hypothetical protein